MCQNPDESYVWSPENMSLKCAEAFFDPITQLLTLPGAQAMVLQGRLLKKLVPDLLAAAAVQHFPHQSHVLRRPFEVLFTCLA